VHSTSACTLAFSSTHNTWALSERFVGSPTMSHTFSTSIARPASMNQNSRIRVEIAATWCRSGPYPTGRVPSPNYTCPDPMS